MSKSEKWSKSLGVAGALSLLILAGCGASQPDVTKAPTETKVTPKIQVEDQAIKDDVVTIEKVVAEGPSWVVIHTDVDGQPGPTIGETMIPAGETNNLLIKIDSAKATDMLYAMLHSDTGLVGKYEYPEADAPAMADGKIVNEGFKVTMNKPDVKVSDQDIKNSSVMLDKVIALQAGWVVIHTDVEGKPGPTIGQVAVPVGESTNLAVKIDQAKATETLYAMLHLDDKTIGKYEFPDADAPVMVNGQAVSPSFKVKKTAAEAMKKDEPKKEEAKTTKTETPKAETKTTTPSTKTFTMTAEKYSFEPATITVNKGDKVILNIKSTDVTHGFALSDFGVDTVLKAGQTTKVEFTADKAGTFSFFCSVFCGTGHNDMKGTLIVK